MIANLHETKLNGYKLHLGEEKQLRFSGWKGIKLYLKDTHDNLTLHTVIEGIYSKGGGNKIKPWMDLNYRDVVSIQRSYSTDLKVLQLSKDGLTAELFNQLGGIIPPGGHLMVSYEGPDLIHTETLKSLNVGVPPAATPIGFLLFCSGFQYIKDWYLAEGGHEGPRKLWGEKSPDKGWEKIYYQKTEKAINQFLMKYYKPTHKKLLEDAIVRAEKILSTIEKTG